MRETTKTKQSLPTFFTYIGTNDIFKKLFKNKYKRLKRIQTNFPQSNTLYKQAFISEQTKVIATIN